MAKAIKLLYFPVMSRGHSIRLLLHHANIEFEDHIIDLSEWPTHKNSGKFEFGQVPVVDIDGELFSQQRAILRYLGQMYGYYPKDDPKMAYRIDSFLDGLEDAWTAGFAYVVAKEFKGEKGWEDLLPDGVQKFKDIMNIAQNRLQLQKTQYLAGDKLSIADINFYSHLKALPFNHRWAQNYGDLDTQFPLLMDYYKTADGQLAQAFKKSGGEKYII